MEKFFEEIKKFLQDNQNPHLRLPDHVDTILQEKDSNWSFTAEIQNTTTTAKEIALLTGDIDTSRYQTINASNQYVALGGGLVTTPYPQGEIINLKDNPRLINKVSDHPVDCVASQEHHSAATEPAIPKQVIYKDATGEVSVTSKDFFFNFLKDFIKNAPSRIFELQLTTDNKELFSSRIYLKSLNPYQRQQPQFINIEDYYLPDNAESVKVIIPVPFNITHETLLAIKIPAATRCTVGFRASAWFSEANAIKNELKPGTFLEKLAMLTDENTQNTTNAIPDKPISGINIT